MFDLPTQAEVRCLDGAAECSTYVIANPDNRQITHLVVKSSRSPFGEYLVPVEMIEKTTPNRIMLKCTKDDLNEMEPFEHDEYMLTRLAGSGIQSGPYVLPAGGYEKNGDVDAYIPVTLRNIPQGEKAVRRGARVVASDGYVGQVDELFVDSNNMQVTHLVLLERHLFKKREITIPVLQIDYVSEDTIYLKQDRKSIEELPTTPIQRWLQ